MAKTEQTGAEISTEIEAQIHTEIERGKTAAEINAETQADKGRIQAAQAKGQSKDLMAMVTQAIDAQARHVANKTKKTAAAAKAKAEPKLAPIWALGQVTAHGLEFVEDVGGVTEHNDLERMSAALNKAAGRRIAFVVDVAEMAKEIEEEETEQSA